MPNRGLRRRSHHNSQGWFPCELWCERRLRPRLGIQTTVQRYPELSTEGLFTHTYIYLSSYLSLWIFPGFCVLHSLASIHSVSLSLSRVHELSISLFLFRSFGSSCSDHLCFSNLYNIYIYIYVYVPRVSRQIRNRLIFFFSFFLSASSRLPRKPLTSIILSPYQLLIKYRLLGCISRCALLDTPVTLRYIKYIYYVIILKFFARVCVVVVVAFFSFFFSSVCVCVCVCSKDV